MPTQAVPPRCPHCLCPTIVMSPCETPRCAGCGRAVPLGPPTPTEAERLRMLVAWAVPFATALAVNGNASAADWLVEARKELEGEP